MARQSLGDKAASITITMRVTPEEKAGLERLVRERQVELSRQFPGVEITLASLLRGLVQREIAGERPEAKPTPAPAPKTEVPKSRQLEIPTAPPTPREANSGKRKQLTEEGVRERLVQALADKATTAKAIADAVGTYHQMVSSWKSGKATIDANMIPKVHQTLEQLGR